MDALSRSVTSQLDKLKHGVTAGAEGWGAAVTQAKIHGGVQNRKLKSELDGRISALERRLVQCEKNAVGSGFCWISVRETATQVYENEVIGLCVLHPICLDNRAANWRL